MFHAYCWTSEGDPIPGYVEIKEDLETIMHYFTVQAPINPTVVVDRNGLVIAEMENRVLAFPETEKEVIIHGPGVRDDIY